MAREFRLPDIGEGLTEAEVVRWLIPVGGHVEADQAIVEVETDKAVVEIPSPYAGVVLRHGGAEGETIEVGQVLVVISEPGEETVMAEPAAQDSPAQAPVTLSRSKAGTRAASAGQRISSKIAWSGEKSSGSAGPSSASGGE